MRNRLLLAAAFVLTLSTLIASLSAKPPAAAPAKSPDWPTFLGPHRDAHSPDTGLLKAWPKEGPPLLWKVDDLGHGYSSVAISAEALYTTGDLDGKLILRAFNLAGKPLWQAEAGPITNNVPGSRSTPTLDGTRVYILGSTGDLNCFDAKAGAKIWSRKMKEFGGDSGGWGYAESPLILGNGLIVKPGGKTAVVALDKLTGKDIWRSNFAAGPEYSSCILIDAPTPQIVTGTSEGIVGFNPQTGAKLWLNAFCKHNTANIPTPAYSDGYLFWANGYGKGGIGLKLAANGTAAEAWHTEKMDLHLGGYIIDRGCIYAGESNGWLCLDLKTGEKKWSSNTVGKGTVCYADGMLYIFSDNGGQATLATCSPDKLEIKGQFKVAGQKESWAAPVVLRGRLYLRYDTNLYCYDIKAK